MEVPFYQYSGTWIDGLPAVYFGSKGITLSFEGASIKSCLTTRVTQENRIEYVLSSSEGTIPLGATLPSYLEVLETMHLMDYVKTAKQDDRYWHLMIACRDVSVNLEQCESIIEKLNLLVAEKTECLFTDNFHLKYDHPSQCYFIYWHFESEVLTRKSNEYLNDFIVQKIDELELEEEKKSR